MFDKSDIRAAVEGGAISDEAAKRFEAFLKARNDPDRMLDPENLRFLSNFNDVFLTIGIVILMVGLTVMSGITVWNLFGLQALGDAGNSSAAIGKAKMAAVAAGLPIIAAAWLWRVRAGRMAAPADGLAMMVLQHSAALLPGLAGSLPKQSAEWSDEFRRLSTRPCLSPVHRGRFGWRRLWRRDRRPRGRRRRRGQPGFRLAGPPRGERPRPDRRRRADRNRDRSSPA